MPRPRFEKLALEKRQRILEAAAQAFAASGFENASLNQILDAAGISKGAAYYYFDDKADLFATVVGHYFGVVFEQVPADFFVGTTTDEFWRGLETYLREAIHRLLDKPWILGLMLALWRLEPQARGEGPLKPLFDVGQNWLQQLVSSGRKVGAFRTDLPEDLLVAWLAGLDLVTDQWLADNLAKLDDEVVDSFTLLAIDILHRLFDPPAPGREVVLKLSNTEE